MERITPIIKFLNKSFGIYEFKGIYIEPRYWMAGAIVLLIFLLIFTLARLRFLYIHWSFSKPALTMIFWGFILAIIMEGFFLVFGKTIFTEILGWRNAPKPISTILEKGRSKLTNVLGASSPYIKPTYKDVINAFEDLEEKENEMVRDYICK